MMILIVFLAIILLAVLAVLLYVFRRVYYHPLKKRKTGSGFDFSGSYAPFRAQVEELIKKLEAEPFERVEIIAFDGRRLSGRYYHHSDSAPLDILMHGYRSHSSIDFCGGFQLAREMGHNILLVDQRACGLSEGRVICFGVKERRDCHSWINYALCRFGEDIEINLFGVSMGGAAVIMANDLGLPENVKRIVADSPFASPRAIISTVAEKEKLPEKPVWAVARMSARLFGGFDPEESSAIEAAKSCKVPLLIICGEADRLVPAEMSRQIHENCPGSELLSIPGADHVAGLLLEPERYKKKVWEFFGLA